MPIILRALPAAALALAVLCSLAATPALAASTDAAATALRPLQTFDAEYRLKVDRWPRRWKNASR